MSSGIVAVQAAPLVPTSLDAPTAGWLLSYSSENTRSAYLTDLRLYLEFCFEHELDPRQARRPHIDGYARWLEHAKGFAPASVARKLSALSSWYDWLLAEELIARNPVALVRRPRVASESSTLGPTMTEARALLAAADDLGSKAAALIALLLLNGLRVSEVVKANVEDLGEERGHRVLRVHRKGGRVALVPLAPRTAAAIDLALDERTEGPLLLGEHGGRGTTGRLTRAGAAYIVQRVAREAGLTKRLTPHSLRHGFVTLSLESGVALSDVQDAAGHADPRTTRRYDRARHRLDAAPTYALAAAVSKAA
jgi:site-specific recombinase XerD